MITESDIFSRFRASVLSNLGFEPSQGQDRLFYAFTRFIYSTKPRCALLLKGYAGTGKTTSVSAIVRTLAEYSIPFQLLAPTGRAAKVLSSYSGRNAWTIHRQIYNKRNDRSGRGWFELRENMERNTVFFVDEASMIGTGVSVNSEGDIISGDLLDDLMSHVFSGDNCRIVIIGDNAQLPPVGSEKSPALDIEYLRRTYDLNIAEVQLNEVIRQAEGSGILENATRIRQLIVSGKNELPKFYLDHFKDVIRVNEDLTSYFEQAYSRYGKDEMIIITRSNKRANLFNQQVRARILWHEEEINAGDRMMVLKNNYYWLTENQIQAGFIANGDVIQIERILRFEDRGNFRFCKAIVSLVDYPDLPSFETILLCNAIWEESASVSYEKLKDLARIIAEDYPDITNQGQLRKKILQDPYYNALQVKFAYAVTCHKAQGGQWPCVFIDQGYLTDEMAGIELNRWFYTAVTRATEELYLLGFSDAIFEA